MLASEGSGLKDWRNIGALLYSHEKSIVDNFHTWKEIDLRLSAEKTIDDMNQRKIKEEEYWQQIPESLIALVRILATQNLGFRALFDSKGFKLNFKRHKVFLQILLIRICASWNVLIIKS